MWRRTRVDGGASGANGQGQAGGAAAVVLVGVGGVYVAIQDGAFRRVVGSGGSGEGFEVTEGTNHFNEVATGGGQLLLLIKRHKAHSIADYNSYQMCYIASDEYQ